MELYISPLSCSLAARIVAREAGISLALHQVEVHAKTLTDTGGTYLAIAPFGQVPALRLDDGTLLTELTAIAQYLADLRPESRLLPPATAAARYDVLAWLGFVATELHKKILWPLFNHGVPDAVRAFARASAPRAFDHVAHHLAADSAGHAPRAHLVGDHFTIADAYLVWALHLARIAGLDPAVNRPALADYIRHHRTRDSVRDLFAEETPLALAAMARQPEPPPRADAQS
ncbi:MAG TPA: glutathione S-transferase N-terminal domain-containing protein [Kofleriaceae bacterium]|nr:glutathione S-transferase N-terminal domain-containing protein [Kofleriaceae bacterium]